MKAPVSPLRWTLLAAAGVLLLAGSLLARYVTGPYPTWVAVLIAVQVVGGVTTPVAAWAWRGERVGRAWLIVVLVFAVLVRLVAMGSHRMLSDDAARYHWDGKCVAHGLNPYINAPADSAVDHVRGDALDQRINHPEYRTCYPPLAQIVFTAGYRTTPGRLLGFQLLCLAAEIAAWLLLLRALPRWGRPRSAVLLLAWAPLAVFQGYVPGHIDTLTLPLVVALVLAAGAGRGALTGAALAAAALIKPLPLWHAPALARELGWKGAVAMAAVFAAIVTVAYVPFLRAGAALFESTWAMAAKWSHNGSVAALLEMALPRQIAHWIAGALLLALLALGLRYGRDLVARMILAQTAFIICTPTLFPWYLVGLLPLLALRPVLSLLALVALMPLADEVIVGYQVTGAWEPAPWPRLAIYLPFYLLLIRDLRPATGSGSGLIAGRATVAS